MVTGTGSSEFNLLNSNFKRFKRAVCHISDSLPVSECHTPAGGHRHGPAGVSDRRRRVSRSLTGRLSQDGHGDSTRRVQFHGPGSVHTVTPRWHHNAASESRTLRAESSGGREACGTQAASESLAGWQRLGSAGRGLLGGTQTVVTNRTSATMRSGGTAGELPRMTISPPATAFPTTTVVTLLGIGTFCVAATRVSADGS